MMPESTTNIPLSLHDALPILRDARVRVTLIDRNVYKTFQPLLYQVATAGLNPRDVTMFRPAVRSEEHTSELQSRGHLVCRLLLEKKKYRVNTYSRLFL